MWACGNTCNSRTSCVEGWRWPVRGTSFKLNVDTNVVTNYLMYVLSTGLSGKISLNMCAVSRTVFYRNHKTLLY